MRLTFVLTSLLLLSCVDVDVVNVVEVVSAFRRTATVQNPPPRVIHIAAERFTFTPSDITVEQGATVEFRLTSDDTSHGFRLSGPGNVNVEIPKRGRGDVRVLFEATEPGRYTFECSLVCGAGHSFMRGTVRVTPRRSAALGPEERTR